MEYNRGRRKEVEEEEKSILKNKNNRNLRAFIEDGNASEGYEACVSVLLRHRKDVEKNCRRKDTKDDKLCGKHTRKHGDQGEVLQR